MKKRAKRLIGALALATGAAGAALWLRRGAAGKPEDKATKKRQRKQPNEADRWARPGMSVTFRAELRPGLSRAERTFRIEQVLPSGRVVLQGFAGEHTETEFEPER
ncbi:MAG TPA: hypothetical protein VNA19_15395 [Pyrinomonadaceae bacterium]|jgi:hypothetical protein|nr:hypothetical protein [Pyrinomonadaceae bacterium]